MKTISVFEHQLIRVGDTVKGVQFTEDYFNALARLSERQQHKYYTLVHKGIRFSHYVGALQVGKLTIEILPKADKKKKGNHALWHTVLIDMLRTCRLLKIESMSVASLKIQPNSILDFYFSWFLDEIEILLRKGLYKSYRKKEGNVTALKGRILFAKQVQQNTTRKERFYTTHSCYDFQHLTNQIIYKTLEVLEKLIRSSVLLTKLKQLKARFPVIENDIRITSKTFQQINFNRKTAHYQTALEISQLVLLNYSPDIRTGRHDVLAILFDMNLLFEEFVFQQLKRLQSDTITVRRQQAKPFWKRRYIKPDILVNINDETFVLDTKWKILERSQPSIQDLKQMFIYNQYFDANRSVLLYPQIGNLKNLPPTPFHPVKDSSTTYYCQLNFVDVLDNEKLNTKVGQQLLEELSSLYPELEIINKNKKI